MLWPLELRSTFLQQERPDRYAAAVCIAIRSDCYADILKAGKLPPVRTAKAQLFCFKRYPSAMTFSSNGYFFFFLAVFFAFFAFLAMLPSVMPKVGLNASHLACIQNTPQLQN
jgi:hypothetical protein